MNRPVVMKIGGGILRNMESFGRVVSIVKKKRAGGRKVIIVISALYGVTDFLIESTHKSLSDGKEISSIISELKKMHNGYLINIDSQKVREAAEFALDDKISLLERFLYGISYLREISPRSRDLIQSFGERLSPVVLEAFLLDKGVDAKFVDAEEAGIICKGPFENAYVDLEATSKNLKKLKNGLNGKVLLLPGYYGVDENGDVKTFGRGGTDYSSGFIANIFDADLEIWKDVSGFMSADPKVVKDAMQIPRLSYEEAEELGYMGAKILHPKTIGPLREKGLTAEIKNVFAPEVKGTIIAGVRKKHDGIVKSISAINDIAIVNVESTSMVNTPGFAAIVFEKLAEKGIVVNLIVTSEATISFSLEPKNLETAVAALNSIKSVYPSEVSFQKNLSLVGVIGDGMKETPGIAGRIFSSLGKAGINVELVSQGASELNVTFVVKKENLSKAILAVHNEFV